MRKTLNGWASNITTVQISRNTLQKLQSLKIKYGARSYEELINMLVSIAENNNSKDPFREKLCQYWQMKTGPHPAKGWMSIFLKLNILKEDSDGTFTLSEEFCRGYIPAGEG